MAEMLPTALLLPSKQEVCFPAVFQTVKAIVRANAIADDTRTTLKGWLKSNDVLLSLLSLTVVHAISLNASLAVRTHLAGPKWMPRLEKLLLKPPSQSVGEALAQLLLDWAYIFRVEELGIRSRTVLSLSPKYRMLLDSISAGVQQEGWSSQHDEQVCVGPSARAVAVSEELAMGLPPVGPRKAPDFVKIFLAGHNSSSGGFVQHDAATAPSAPSALTLQQQPRQGAEPPFSPLVPVISGDDPPLTGLSIFNASVDSTIAVMQSHAAELEHHVAAAKVSLHQGSKPMTTVLDNGYIAAQRCHVCRGWVQKLSQTTHDERAVSQLLAVTDVINGALAAWQALTTSHLYKALNMTVPPLAANSSGRDYMVARHMRVTSGTAAASAAKTAGAVGKSTDLLGLDELLGDLAGAQEPAPGPRRDAAGPSSRRSSGGGGRGAGSVRALEAGNAGVSSRRGSSGDDRSSSASRGAALNPFAGMCSRTGTQLTRNPFEDLLTPPMVGEQACSDMKTGASASSNSTSVNVAWPARAAAKTLGGGSMALSDSSGGSTAEAAAAPHGVLGLSTGALPSWVTPSLQSGQPRPTASQRGQVPSAPPLNPVVAVVPSPLAALATAPILPSSQSSQGQQQHPQQESQWVAFESSVSLRESVERGSSTPSPPPNLTQQQQQQHGNRPTGRRPHQQQELSAFAARQQHQQHVYYPPVPLDDTPQPHLEHQQQQHHQNHQQQHHQTPHQLEMAVTPEFDALCLQLLQQHSVCASCHKPAKGLSETVLQMQQLVAGMRAEHAAAQEAMSKAHLAEVSAIKATSVQKFKELMAHQQQQQQQWTAAPNSPVAAGTRPNGAIAPAMRMVPSRVVQSADAFAIPLAPSPPLPPHSSKVAGSNAGWHARDVLL